MNLAPSNPSSESFAPRILIVEDEAIIAEEILERLERLRYDVVGIADTAVAAIDAARSARPDLVLMDIRLKGARDGIDAAEEIRRTCDVPVVYLTAHSEPHTLRRARATAPYGYLLKPIHERELEAMIETVIERHKLESQLRASELRYSATLSSIADGVLATDSAGRVTFLNPVAESLTGWNAGDAHLRPGDEVLAVVYERTREPMESPIRRAMQSRAAIRLEPGAMLVARDGSTVPIDDSAAPIVDSFGNVIGAVVAFHDVRERRHAEEALRKTEAELQQAQKLESVGQLAGGVAHDFNNFLTAVNGYCELLQRSGTLDEPNTRYVQRILESSERAAALIRQLMTFSRKQPTHAVVISPNDALQSVRGLLRRLIRANIRLDVRCAPDAPSIVIDPTQFEQILMNLVANARDAMPAGGEIVMATEGVTIRDEPSQPGGPPPGEYLLLRVRDTGTGMDEQTRRHIFEPFFTTKDPGKGTGLGLATVYSIVQQCGGAIRVTSEPGVGSEFSLYFPRAASGVLPDAQRLPADSSGDERILVVDDDDMVLQVVAASLARFGYRISAAAGVAEALALFEREADGFHLLITDMNMPDRGGWELARAVRQRSPDLPVLFLSGAFREDSRESLSRFPRSGFLLKPCSSDQLAREARRLLEQARPRPDGTP